jgi:hypothetical protein
MLGIGHPTGGAKYLQCSSTCALLLSMICGKLTSSKSYDFILSVTGTAVIEDLSPSHTKVAVIENGYLVHNITGIRAHIVSRMDGRGYDLTKRKASIRSLYPH